MASSKQTNKIVTHGKYFIKSALSKRPPSSLENDDSRGESFQQKNTRKSDTQDKRQQAIRPNAFLSFRIKSQQIIDHANEIQKHIIESNPLLSKASTMIKKG
ncbi:unnamed protein product [Rotaria socialis]|uniref:Uncharacterized protein n=1 Tax=Rotaria socialis TaxID=392032 RepID=A0A817LFH1_9BILA|nr:unnamed protein product [Rotaria socialis]